MRKISTRKDENGIFRLQLNNEDYFQFGTLDQGWWPDGLYTAPSDDALKYDIIKTKELGFNMIRKHVKVEPARWYYHADKIGMLVWQDMPNGEKFSLFLNGREINFLMVMNLFQVLNLKIILEVNGKKLLIFYILIHQLFVGSLLMRHGGQFKTVEISEWTKLYDS